MTCDDCGNPLVRCVTWQRERDSSLCRSCAATRRGLEDEAHGFAVAASWREIASELDMSKPGVIAVYERAMRKLRAYSVRHGGELRALLVAMQEQEPVDLGGRQTRRHTS